MKKTTELKKLTLKRISVAELSPVTGGSAEESKMNKLKFATICLC